MSIKYTDLNPKLPSREERNAVTPRKIFLKKNIDYVTRVQPKSQGSFNHGNSQTIELFDAIQTALDRSWITITAADGDGIYSGSGSLTGDTVVTCAGNDLAFNGDYITMTMTNSGTGVFNVVTQPSAFNSATLALNPNSGSYLQYRIDGNNYRSIAVADDLAVLISGEEGGVNYAYRLPAVNPTSDATPYVIAWTDNVPAFTALAGASDELIKVSANDTTAKYLEDVLDATSPLEITTLNEGVNETVVLSELTRSEVPVDTIQRVSSPINTFAHGGVVKTVVFSGTVEAATAESLNIIPVDAAVDTDGMLVYFSMRGMVKDTVTLDQWPIGDSAASNVIFGVEDNSGPQFLVDNLGGTNDCIYVVIFEYLVEA